MIIKGEIVTPNIRMMFVFVTTDMPMQISAKTYRSTHANITI